ncbi:MAG TPA: c-type cytochrome [Candidatus Cybelea sp.]|jgi:thiosulfate dehydrogenase|nr:c-type cytochrome [Candidatus Cybelea sp.]
MNVRARPAPFALAAILAITGCSSDLHGSSAYDARTLPSGPVGQSIAYGREIVMDTQTTMKGYVRAKMSCAACHVAGGTRPRGGSFVGIYGAFPQWNRRAHRVIALQDRIAECFLYSMNGRPPAYDSKAMIAVVAYIAWLSRGTPAGRPQAADLRYIEPLPSESPNPQRGAVLYAQKCAACHRSNGGGQSNVFPPLWGRNSFNGGAGMAHIDRMTGFLRYNMPQNAPGSLSLAQAYDIAAYVLSHARPHFDKNALVVTPSLPARSF